MLGAAAWSLVKAACFFSGLVVLLDVRVYRNRDSMCVLTQLVGRGGWIQRHELPDILFI